MTGDRAPRTPPAGTPQSPATAGQQLMRDLRARGVDHVFGIPGVHTIELLRDIPEGMRFVVPRHEQGAGFMADGYARISGRPGVCVLVTGPGVTNALTPIAQAYHDSVALLVIASECAAHGHEHGRLHELPDQRSLLAQVTGASARVPDPASLPGAVAEAWRALSGPRPRPAAIGIPIDVIDQPAAPLPAAPPSAGVPAPAASDLDRAACLLDAADQVAIVLGGGAAAAGDAARRLAAALDAPVVLTGNAAGAIPDSDPLCLGVSLPFAPVLDLLDSADVVLLVGTELSPVDRIYSGAPLELSGQVIRVDVDPLELAHGPVAHVAIHADSALALNELSARLTDRLERDPEESRGDTRGRALVRRLRAARNWTAQSRAHFPWLQAIDRGVPAAERIVALDSTQLAYTALHALPVQRPRSLLAPFGLGTLGPAVPMGIGAALAAPDRPVVAIVGDGGLMFTVAELATASQLRVPLAVVVWNSGGYAEIDDSFARAHAAPVGVELALGPLRSLAEGLGCASSTARSPAALERALRDAVDRDRPTLIEVPAVR